MSLRDYYRCKRCDSKIAYGPDRPEEDWEPFLLCRDCVSHIEEALREAIDRMELMEKSRHSGFIPMCEACITYAKSALAKPVTK